MWTPPWRRRESAGASARGKNVRIRKLGSIDADELERMLAETGGVKPSACRPKTRHSVDPLKLTDTQCSVFPTRKKIGAGSFATVFEHADDPAKVVKFTTDVNDARSAAAIKGKKLNGSVHVFDVAELTGVAGFKTIYGIVAERVQPVDDSTGSAVVDFFDSFLGEEIEDRKVAGNRIVPGAAFDLGPDFTERAIGDCGNTVIRDADVAACPVLIPKLVDAVSEAATVGGIFTNDLHAGNWGYRPDGSPVILDFGLSKIDTAAQKPVQALAKAPQGRRAKRRRF